MWARSRPSGEALTAIKEFLEAVYGHGDGWVHVTTTKRQIAAAKTAQVADLVPHIEGPPLSSAPKGDRDLKDASRTKTPTN